MLPLCVKAMGSNIEYLTFCLETTAECRQIRTFLRPAPEATNPLRGRRILQPWHLPYQIRQSSTEMLRRKR